MRKHVPSYISSRTFALALLDTLTDIHPPDAGTTSPAGAGGQGGATPAGAGGQGGATPPAGPGAPAGAAPANPNSPAGADDVKDLQAREEYDLLNKASGSVDKLADSELKRTLTRLLSDAAGSRQRFVQNIERWFDANMDRASGWYKRRTVVFMWVIAAVVVLVLNADTFQVASGLWRNDTLRAAVVAKAQQAIRQAPPAQGTTPDVNGLGGQANDVARQIGNVKDLGLPLGWSFHKADPRWPDSFPVGFLVKLVGLFVTVVALTLGAPFWFDLLGRVSRLRSTGTPKRAGAA